MWPCISGNLGWWNIMISVGLSDVAGVTKNIWGQPWLEMPGHGTMARWEISVLESQNQLMYPDSCKEIGGWWISDTGRCTVHWVPGFVVAPMEWVVIFRCAGSLLAKMVKWNITQVCLSRGVSSCVLATAWDHNHFFQFTVIKYVYFWLVVPHLQPNAKNAPEN